MLDEFGREVPNPVPVARSVKFEADPLAERIRQMIRGELSRAAREVGTESFEDADDFDVDDDPEIRSPYELDDGQMGLPWENPKASPLGAAVAPAAPVGPAPQTGSAPAEPAPKSA